jgi:glycosyltransferase 2 family protein
LSKAPRKWLFRIASFVIAGVLLYLALRGVDFERVGNDLANGHYIWVVPLIVLTLVSHLIRAWRWKLFLHALPLNGSAGKEISTRSAFFSLMIGYMSNYAAPRIGEVVRSANLAAQEDRTFGGVLGTVVVERVLDVITLGLALLTLPLVLGSRMEVLTPLLVDPVLSLFHATPAWVLVLLLLLFFLAVALIRLAWLKLHNTDHQSKFKHAIVSFREGIASLRHTGRPLGLLISTLAMWACYTMMAYLPLKIFGLTSLYHLSLFDAWGLMLLGSIGVVIPSPGGIGSYHYITIQSLVLLFAVPQESAASYAIFTHAGQLILYVIIGFTALLIEGASWSELKSAGRGA